MDVKPAVSREPRRLFLSAHNRRWVTCSLSMICEISDITILRTARRWDTSGYMVHVCIAAAGCGRLCAKPRNRARRPSVPRGYSACPRNRKAVAGIQESVSRGWLILYRLAADAGLRRRGAFHHCAPRRTRGKPPNLASDAAFGARAALSRRAVLRRNNALVHRGGALLVRLRRSRRDDR